MPSLGIRSHVFDDKGTEMGLDGVVAQIHFGRFCEILGVGSKNQNILATMVNPPALGFSCSDVPTPRVSFYSFAPSVTQSF